MPFDSKISVLAFLLSPDIFEHCWPWQGPYFPGLIRLLTTERSRVRDSTYLSNLRFDVCSTPFFNGLNAKAESCQYFGSRFDQQGHAKLIYAVELGSEPKDESSLGGLGSNLRRNECCIPYHRVLLLGVYQVLQIKLPGSEGKRTN